MEVLVPQKEAFFNSRKKDKKRCRVAATTALALCFSGVLKHSKLSANSTDSTGEILADFQRDPCTNTYSLTVYWHRSNRWIQAMQSKRKEATSSSTSTPKRLTGTLELSTLMLVLDQLNYSLDRTNAMGYI